MNHLEGTRVYLAGPIENSDDAVSWREAITPALHDLKIKVWNPLIKPDWTGNIDGKNQRKLKEIIRSDPKDGGRPNLRYLDHIHSKETKLAFEQNKHIRTNGLRLASAADFIICRMTGEFTAGTFEEIAEGKRCGKPVLFWIDDKYMSMWLIAQFCEHPGGEHRVFYETCDDLIEFLSSVDRGNYTIEPSQWIFMEWKDA